MAFYSAWPPKPPTGSLHVPKGFSALMEVFLEALVKDKPYDPFQFGAEFFDRLVQVRRDTGHDPILHGSQSRDTFIGVVTLKSGKPSSNKGQKNSKKNAWSDSVDAKESDVDIAISGSSGESSEDSGLE